MSILLRFFVALLLLLSIGASNDTTGWETDEAHGTFYISYSHSPLEYSHCMNMIMMLSEPMLHRGFPHKSIHFYLIFGECQKT
jgi:hypothetical protein